MLGVSEESKAYRLYDIEAAYENNNIEAADENTAEENKRPPVWMRDYEIGEDFCEDVDE